MPYTPYQICSFDLFNQMLADLRDDPSLPWSAFPCLLWPRGTRNGYGEMKHLNQKFLVHRAALESVKGPIPERYEACHHCDVRRCFRPVHLFAGSRSDNAKDGVAKGRWSINFPSQIGQLNNNSKLSSVDVLKIRKLNRRGTPRTRIAELFDVSKVTVGHIVKCKTWSHLIGT